MANILLGVCGGIAAYKSCEIVRLLKKQNHDVQVILTTAAQEFVTKLTFESLSGNRAHSDLFSDGEMGTAHIDVARWADVFVIAPTTSDCLSRLATGHSNDFLSTVFLAYEKQTWIAPSMNTSMWNHELVQENLSKLKKIGVFVVEPEEGLLACGEYGDGKMASPETIVKNILSNVSTSPLSGKNIVITAGPTREYIDAVRFVSSPSTGKMGLAIAKEAHARGANVTLIHGPIHQKIPLLQKTIAVTSAEEMYQASMQALPADIFVSTAAVSDMTPAHPSDEKIKKTAGASSIAFVSTKDIAKEVGKKKRTNDLLIGFAAESENEIGYAKKKLTEKNMDLIVANRVYRETEGFQTDETSVTFISPTAEETLSSVSKTTVAKNLWDRVERILLDRHRK